MTKMCHDSSLTGIMYTDRNMPLSHNEEITLDGDKLVSDGNLYNIRAVNRMTVPQCDVRLSIESNMGIYENVWLRPAVVASPNIRYQCFQVRQAFLFLMTSFPYIISLNHTSILIQEEAAKLTQHENQHGSQNKAQHEFQHKTQHETQQKAQHDTENKAQKEIQHEA
ncbi:hypothetical protein MAR_036724 [Mya arenaria]|uniref:Uncharacterized protein n=1 Tax=Mya arenaria TaxID=6604 RepID=A0ABY7FLX2_MYAAR|nr:hypothetical protein MAR_036724 [Mya arenaria]